MAKKKKGKKVKPKNREFNPTEEEAEKLLTALKALYADGSALWCAADEEKFEGMPTVSELTSASTYGEITMQGVTTVMRKFAKKFKDPDCVFYDLGCGLGRLVGQVALLSNAKKSIGVELCPNRIAAARNLADSITFPATKPTFIEGNFLEQDYSDATIVYIDNTIYPTKVLDQVLSILPPDCILIYQSGWQSHSVPAFPVETTYNIKYRESGKLNTLLAYLGTHCAWRPVKGFEF